MSSEHRAPVATRHIALMYDEAALLSRGLTGVPSPTEFERTLDRIDNLVAHARAELQDEYLRWRDGWAVV